MEIAFFTAIRRVDFLEPASVSTAGGFLLPALHICNMYPNHRLNRLRVKWFLSVASFLNISVVVWSIRFGKASFFEKIRTQGHAVADAIAPYLTHLGDGATAILIGMILLVCRLRAAYLVFFSYASSGLLAQLLKRITRVPRPAPYFASIGQSIRQVDGVELLQANNSFPSGHSATVFALASSLVLLTACWNRFWYVALVLAVLVGYTRIYLGQHFAEDVTAGAVLGISCTLTCYLLLKKKSPRWMSGAKWNWQY